MIGRLNGKLIEKQAPMLLIDVGGVCYEVQAPMSTFYQLPEIGNNVVLHTHFVVREDAQLLYGFYTKQERALFRALIKVSGIGPKLGITILSGIEPKNFARCIKENDIATLKSLPGIGATTAERLIVDMRKKLSDWMEGELPMGNLNDDAALLSKGLASNVSDAISALIALGYKPNDAHKSVHKISDRENLTSEELIRCALQKG